MNTPNAGTALDLDAISKTYGHIHGEKPSHILICQLVAEVRRLREAVARVITLPTVAETEIAAQANADAFLDECEDVPPHVERALRAALTAGFKAGTLWFAEKLLMSDARLGTIR